MKPLPLVCALLGLTAARGAGPASVELTPLADRVRVTIDGQLFTEYIYGDGASRSYFYPILAPDGTPLTRNFPMRKATNEDTDHPWQRSMWFAHSMVGGVDFWNEGQGDAGKSPSQKGHTRLDGKIEIASGSRGTIQARDLWLDPANNLVARDERQIAFSADEAGRYIDFTITLRAPAGRPLLMGDNKDGTMAIRLAQWMTLPHKFKGAPTGGSGHIVTATGERDGESWGKRADWCAYYAEHDGKSYGVAIFDHPANLRHPTWWMARDYGLFGANPFGRHDYENLKDQPHIGDYTIPAGGSLTLSYRCYFYAADQAAADPQQHYRAWAEQPVPQPSALTAR